MHAVLERDHLIRPCAFPDWHGELVRLEIHEVRRQRMAGQGITCAFAVEVGFAAQRGLFYPELLGVEQVVGHLGQFDHVVVGQPRLELSALPGQLAGGDFSYRQVPFAVRAEATLERCAAVVAQAHLRLLFAGGHVLRFLQPVADFGFAGKGFGGHVLFVQQAGVIAIAGIDPGAVDMRHCDAGQVRAGHPSDVTLDGCIVSMVGLDLGGRLHFHHAPYRFAGGQHNVGKGQRPIDLEAGLEDWLRACQQLLRAAEGGCVAVLLRIQQHATAFGVIGVAGDFADGVANRERGLRRGGIHAQVGAMHFQPQPLRALAEGQQF